METQTMALPERKTRQLLRDRRASTRFPCTLRVTCRRSAGTAFPATVRDISQKGVGLLMAQAVPLEALLTVQLWTVRGDDVMIAEAQVVYTHPDSQGWVHGCKFLRRLSEQDLSNLLEEASPLADAP